MIDRSWVGREIGRAVLPIEAGRLKFFAKAIGETSPVYTDEAAARAAGYRSIPAPPTFLFAAGLDAGVTLGLMAELSIPLSKVLHGEQGFEYLGPPVVAGDTITVTTQVQNIYDKKNGALEFVELVSQAVTQDGRDVARLRSLIVVRN